MYWSQAFFLLVLPREPRSSCSLMFLIALYCPPPTLAFLSPFFSVPGSSGLVLGCQRPASVLPCISCPHLTFVICSTPWKILCCRMKQLVSFLCRGKANCSKTLSARSRFIPKEDLCEYKYPTKVNSLCGRNMC